MTTIELALSSIDASRVLHRAYMDIAPGYLPHALTKESGSTALGTLDHAQAFVLRTGLEPWRKERGR